MDKASILRVAAEQEIEFIRLQFTDIRVMKSISITVDQLEKALAVRWWDGSSIEGFVRIEESDMYLRPDLDTFLILPWNGSKTARLICDIYDSDNLPFTGSPRYALQRVLQEAKDMGYTMYVGPEPEFFLFQLDEKVCLPWKLMIKPAILICHRLTKGKNPSRYGKDSAKHGFEIEASHHEGAPGQHEIDFKYQKHCILPTA